MNVVRGLKLFEDVFTCSELSKVNDFVNQLQVAGRNGELSGGSLCFVMLLLLLNLFPFGKRRF